MMKYNYGLILLMLFSFFISAKEGDVFNSNQLVIDDVSIFITKKNKEDVLYINKVNKEGVVTQCLIRGWSKGRNAVYLTLTTDKKAILLYPAYFYLDSKQVLECDNMKKVILNKVPVPDADLYYLDATIVDINFEHKLYLSLIPIYWGAYMAIIAKFDSSKSLINAKEFRYKLDDKEKFELIDKDDSLSQYGIADGDIEDEGTFNGGYGAISLDGKYVLLSTTEKLDCSSESYPGLWNIEKKEKVNGSKGSKLLLDKIDDEQCRKIFNDITTLNTTERFGRLVMPLYP